MPNADYYGAAHHETASKFLDQDVFRLNIRQAAGAAAMDFPWPIRFNGAEQRMFCERTDEEACVCNSPDSLAGMGTNEIAAQGRDRARRSLCADWPDRGWQAGLFDEVRKFAGAVATTAG
jgi:hypothetical protein